MNDSKQKPRSISIPSSELGDDPGEPVADPGEPVAESGKPAPLPPPSGVPGTPIPPALELEIFETMTLGDLGMRLPVGLPGMGDRGFAFKEYLLDEEVALAEIKQDKKLTLGSFVARSLAHMLLRVGPYNFAEMTEPDKLLLLYRMYAADVLYMFYQLRIEGMGEFMPYDMKCPRCDEGFGFDANMHTIEVKTTKEPMELVWEYMMKFGVKTRGKTFKKATMKSPHWGLYDSSAFKGAMNSAVAIGALLSSSMIALDDESMVVTDAELRKGIRKYDYEHMSKYMTERMGGPKLALELDCPKCKLSISEPIQWMNPDFLSVTSFKPIRLMT